MQEDWRILKSMFPDGWSDMAVRTHALKGLRQDKSAEQLLRILLMHLGCGYSLRETVVRARRQKLADLSDVGLLKRLRKSKDWLHELCVALFQERGLSMAQQGNFQVRAFDATTVKEQGITGSLWRIHYSISLPSLCCDYFKVTETKGKGTGESFKQFPIKRGDYILADRGYSTVNGIGSVIDKGAYVTVRVNTAALPILNSKGNVFNLLKEVSKLKKADESRCWFVKLERKKSKKQIMGRICVIRKSKEAIAQAQKKAKRDAAKKGNIIRPETLQYAKYIILFTTFPEGEFDADDVLEWYRIRWQIELVFKRFKSIAGLGQLPKSDEESSKAWLYGKLFVALLTEKLITSSESFSPWGDNLEEDTASKSLARIPIYAS